MEIDQNGEVRATTREDKMALMDQMHARIGLELESSEVDDGKSNKNEEEELDTQLRDEKGRFKSSNKEEQEDDAEVEQADESDQNDEEDDDTVEKFLNYEDLRGKRFKGKVNGEEVIFDADELLKQAQKGNSADKRFQEAAKMQKELAEERDNLVKFQQKLIEQQNEHSNKVLKSQEKPALPEKDEEKELFEAIMLGDTEKSQEKLRLVVSKLSSDATERRLQELMSQQTTEMEQKAYTKAYQALQEQQWSASIQEFGAKREDIIGDKFLTTIFDTRLHELAAEFGYTPKVLAQAEKDFDTWADSKGIKTKSSQDKDAEKVKDKEFMAEREQRNDKAKKLSVGQAASAKSQVEKKEVAKQGSDLIQEMMRARQPWKYSDEANK